MFILRDDQEELVDKALKSLEASDRTQIIAACGAGKTISSCRIHDHLIKNKRPQITIVMVPSLILTKQTISAWNIASIENYNYWCVCSDIGVDSENKEGLGVTTDLSTLTSSWEKRDKEISNVFFVTIQSYSVLVKFFKSYSIKADYAIIDEAHKTTGLSFSESTLINLDAYYEIKKRIYLTATPRNVTSKSNYCISMDDEELFGRVCYSLPFSKAISLNLLTKYKILLVGVEDREGESLTGINTVKAYEKVAKKYNLKKTICFHRSVAESKVFGSNSNDFRYLHIDGKMKSSQRSNLMREFATSSKRSIINNARCLTEGVDIPSVDSVMFCSPKTSVVDIVQAVGRAVRKFDKKEYGYIIIPVLKSRDGSAGSYGSILRVIEALAIQDEDLYSSIVLNHSGSKIDDSQDSILNSIIEASEEEIDISKIKINELKMKFRRNITKQDYLNLLTSKRYTTLNDWSKDKAAFPSRSSLETKSYRKEIEGMFFKKRKQNNPDQGFSKQDYLNLLTSKSYNNIGEWIRDKSAKPSRSSLHNKSYKYEIIEKFFGRVVKIPKKKDFIDLLIVKNYQSFNQWQHDTGTSPCATSLKGKPYEKEILSRFFPNMKKLNRSRSKNKYRKDDDIAA